MSSNYNIQATKKNDFIVRRAGVFEVARFATELAATQFITHTTASEAASEAAANARQQAYLALPTNQRPDLDALQLAWQLWRNEQYELLCQEERFVGNNARANELKMGTVHARHDNDLLAREVEQLRAMQRRYRSITQLDSQIKSARRSGDVGALEAALTAAVELMK